jgi:hypothetical protein
MLQFFPDPKKSEAKKPEPKKPQPKKPPVEIEQVNPFVPNW